MKLVLIRHADPDYPNDTLLFVCHGGVIHTLLSHLLNIPLPISYAQFRIDTTSVTTLQFDEKDGYGVFRMIGLNDVSHTASMLDADTNRAARN